MYLDHDVTDDLKFTSSQAFVSAAPVREGGRKKERRKMHTPIACPSS